METLQVAYVTAISAAAGCQLSTWGPDTTKIDVAIMHTSAKHIGDSTAELRVQLKSTYQLTIDEAERSGKDHFSFTLDNKTLGRLNESPVAIPRALFVMVVPRDPDVWTVLHDSHLMLANYCYFIGLEGVQATGKDETVIHIPLENKLDAHTLSSLMVRIGGGGKV